jgi:hypothetical protein
MGRPAGCAYLPNLMGALEESESTRSKKYGEKYRQEREYDPEYCAPEDHGRGREDHY